MQQHTSTQFSDPQEKKPLLANTVSNIKQSKFNQSFYTRTRTTIYMLIGAAFIFTAGHLYCALLVLTMNILIFMQINSLKRNEQKQINIPMTKYINWYLFLVANYFCLGNTIIKKFPYLGIKYQTMGFLLTYHDFFSFCFLIFGFLCFVLSLKQGYLKYQFRLFGWISLTTLIVSYQSWLIINNIFEGMIWFILPSLLIVINDIFAYIVGYFFGKNPLIALSPKKTWQGYIGGAIFTLLFSLILTSVFQKIPGMVCPVNELSYVPFNTITCNSQYLSYLDWSFLPLRITKLQGHILVLSIFASTIGPFGGFFASGLKRSIKIKDFANLIPGHGGVSDRMDCQLIMGSFSYFYIHSLVQVSNNFSSAYILTILSPSKQIQIYKQIQNHLLQKGLI